MYSDLMMTTAYKDNLEVALLTPLTDEETLNIEGGAAPVVGLAAIAAGGGLILGAVVVGAAVGYGTYKLVQWATS